MPGARGKSGRAPSSRLLLLEGPGRRPKVRSPGPEEKLGGLGPVIAWAVAAGLTVTAYRWLQDDEARTRGVEVGEYEIRVSDRVGNRAFWACRDAPRLTDAVRRCCQLVLDGGGRKSDANAAPAASAGPARAGSDPRKKKRVRMSYSLSGVLGGAAAELEDENGESEGGYGYVLRELAKNLEAVREDPTQLADFFNLYT